MNAASPKPAKPDHRSREHRFSKLPFRDVMKITMEEKNIGNVEMQLALGYAKPNVIAMIKSGSMNMSEHKALAVAKVLDLPPLFVLKKLVLEKNPALWDAIEAVMAKQMVLPSELALLDVVRKELDGLDVDLTECPEFNQAVLPALRAIAQRKLAETRATLDRIAREGQPQGRD